MTTTKAQIDIFMKSNSIAVVGISRNKNKFGNHAFKSLKNSGFKVFPISKNVVQIDGENCYASIKDLPEKPEAVLVSVSSEKTPSLINEISQNGIKNVWLQQGCNSKEAVKICKEKNINCISGECILMYYNGNIFPHNFHKFIWKVIGKYPK